MNTITLAEVDFYPVILPIQGYWRHTLARDCHCRGRKDHLLHLPQGEVLQGG